MWIQTVISVFSLFLILQSCSKKNETITPKIQEITESVYASGIIKSKNQYEVFSQTNGILNKVFVTEGAKIQQNDPLFQINNKGSVLATKNARLAATANDLSRNAAQLKDAQSAVDFADKKLKNEYLMYSRQQKLWKSNIGTRVELEQKQLNYEQSKVALAQSKTNFQDLKRQLTLASGQSKTNLQLAQSNENDLIIRSAVDGIVYKINKEQGEMVSTASPLAVLGANDFIIEMEVDELDIVKIKPGQEVLVRMDSYKNQVFKAKVATIYPMMNDRTRSFKVQAVFNRQPDVLFPNLTLEANIVIKVEKDALTIPRICLVNDSTVTLENGKMQAVKIGLMDYSVVEVLGGLSADTRLIFPKK